MNKVTCETCQREPTVLRCGLCEQPTCKGCAHLLEENAFNYLPKVPEHLVKGIYCGPCYDARVADDVANYERTLEAAGQLDLYFKNQGKETRFVRRQAAPIVIKDCADRDEVLLRLAFVGVHLGFKCLVDVEVTGRKVSNGAYQTTVYQGTAVPASPASHQMPRDYSLGNPN